MVDSGSTHNFLDPLVVQAAKLKVHDDSKLQVRVGNGDRLLIKWLKALGPINWDFNSMSMSFVVGHSRVTLCGMKSDGLKVQSGESSLKSSLHNLYANMSKCKLAMHEVDYLGHVISGCGVKANPSKIVSMVEWPIPNSLKALRHFLSLTGYYKKFIRNYGTIVAPLTVLLKKNSFRWTIATSQAFQQF
ncbi:uncharacterized mitochondrial protein AtMg00860-like [Juglans regia]|uniref:Uncharacterized mitochondrial protein AtMg00860-like n=1 Tax=Juglans regia TaxID=51240 RepID=A0A6P9EB42_JUGRE|nr:uncharacterized mitochondrial protein AtMg00860-like [Juglans regia]